MYGTKHAYELNTAHVLILTILSFFNSISGPGATIPVERLWTWRANRKLAHVIPILALG